MMSAGLNAANGGDSTMPGGYESWPAPAARKTPFPSLPNTTPPGRTPFPSMPAGGRPTVDIPGRTPFPAIPPTSRISPSRRPIVPRRHPVRSRSHRRRPHAPEIVIEERSPRSRSTWGRDQVITVALDRRPTLGLRGPPKRYIEIERVRCHRRRRPRYDCYDYEYDHPPPQSQQLAASPQQPVFVAPTVNMNTVAAQPNSISNLSIEMINNLPRQTVHLPAIHLPGSQADANTDLETITFPAEIINPADGSLSIIQNNQGVAHSAANFQPQLTNMPIVNAAAATVPTRGVPLSPAMDSDPFAQRFRDLFQRLTFSQAQPTNPSVIQPTVPNISQNNQPVIRPTLPPMSEFNPATIPANSPPVIRPNINPISAGNYPPANIRPTNPLNAGSYPRPNISPAAPSLPPPPPSNISTYRPSSFTPSATVNNSAYRPNSIPPSNTSDIGPYQRANITPYTSGTNQPAYSPPSNSSFLSSSTARSGPFTPFPSLRPASTTAYGNASVPPPNSTQSVSSTPKSILRNPLSTNSSDTVYTNLNSLDQTSSNDVVRKTARFN